MPSVTVGMAHLKKRRKDEITKNEHLQLDDEMGMAEDYGSMSTDTTSFHG